MTTQNWASPNELVAEAKKVMLDGREPQSYEDWSLILNFLAYNIHAATADAACKLLRTMYQMPLSDSQVTAIVQYQLARRRS